MSEVKQPQRCFKSEYFQCPWRAKVCCTSWLFWVNASYSYLIYDLVTEGSLQNGQVQCLCSLLTWAAAETFSYIADLFHVVRNSLVSYVYIWKVVANKYSAAFWKFHSKKWNWYMKKIFTNMKSHYTINIRFLYFPWQLTFNCLSYMFVLTDSLP